MSKLTNVSKNLSLETETLRVLAASDLDGVVGGVGDSVQSVCIGNGQDNDTHSALGYCPTNGGGDKTDKGPKRTKR